LGGGCATKSKRNAEWTMGRSVTDAHRLGSSVEGGIYPQGTYFGERKKTKYARKKECLTYFPPVPERGKKDTAVLRDQWVKKL